MGLEGESCKLTMMLMVLVDPPTMQAFLLPGAHSPCIWPKYSLVYQEIILSGAFRGLSRVTAL